MAEGLLAAHLPTLYVESAGLGAMVGYGADETVRELMHERGIDIDKHRARQINLDMCQRADLILVMEATQRQIIEKMYPFTNGRVYRVANGAAVDVPDPYRASRSNFVQALSLIEQGVKHWVDKISRVSS